MLHPNPATLDLRTRDDLICQHVPLVHYVVGKMRLDLINAAVDYEDLVGYGIVGLIQALDRFDESLGIPFPGFAVPRIRGTVLDALRSLDHLSRGDRFRAKQIATKHNELAMELGREPTELEVRTAAGLTREQFNTAGVLARATPVPIMAAGESDRPDGYHEPAADLESPTAALEYEQLLGALDKAVQRLPERERMIVGLYYVESLTYREIGLMLDISETRVAQLVQQALRRLRVQPGLVELGACLFS